MADQVLVSLAPKPGALSSPKDTTAKTKSKSKTSKSKKWTRLTNQSNRNVVGQRFWALLQLANNGNVEIRPDFSVAGTENFVDNLEVRLLKGDRLQERFEDMEV